MRGLMNKLVAVLFLVIVIYSSSEAEPKDQTLVDFDNLPTFDCQDAVLTVNK